MDGKWPHLSLPHLRSSVSISQRCVPTVNQPKLINPHMPPSNLWIKLPLFSKAQNHLNPKELLVTPQKTNITIEKITYFFLNRGYIFEFGWNFPLSCWIVSVGGSDHLCLCAAPSVWISRSRALHHKGPMDQNTRL